LNDRKANIASARFSADGATLVTVNTDKSEVVLWNGVTGERLGLLADFEQKVSDVALSRDGQWVVTGFKNGTARIWPVAAAAFAKRHVPRELIPSERDLFDIGNEADRVPARQTWEVRRAARALIECCDVTAVSVEQRRAVRAFARRGLLQFVESLKPVAGSSEVAAALAAVEREIRAAHHPPHLALDILAETLFEVQERGRSIEPSVNLDEAPP
jgi:hypothetical protein